MSCSLDAESASAFLSTTTVPLAVATLEGKVTWLNAALARLLGSDQNAVIGTPLIDLVHETDRDKVASVFDNFDDVDFEPDCLESRFCSGGECEVWLSWSIRADREREFAYCTFRDTTIERHRELELRRLYADTPALLHSVGPTGLLEAVSERWLVHFGYQRSEVLGRQCIDFVAPESREHARSVLGQLKKTGRCEGVEFKWLAGDGSRREVLLSSRAEFNADGSFCRALSVVDDVTAIRETEKSLRRERRLRERLFECAPNAFVLADVERKIVALNPAALSTFKCEASEVDGQTTKILYAQSSGFETAGRGRFNPSLKMSAERKLVEYRRSDGTTFLGETVGGPIRDIDDGVLGYLAVIDDVTDEIRQREELEHSLETLDQFAYIASHDLRTPLRGIQHLIRFLEEDVSAAVAEVLEPRLRQLKERTLRMDEMVSALLKYARAGHIGASIETVDIPELVAGIVADFDHGDPTDTRVEVEVECGPHREIEANRTALRHVVSNLITNAVIHHDRERARIVVTLGSEGSYTRIDVDDDGPGIPSQHHQRVFEIFRTLVPKDQSATTGLGLALVRRITQRVGGDVSAQSPLENGRGTRFRLLWPRQGRR